MIVGCTTAAKHRRMRERKVQFLRIWNPLFCLALQRVGRSFWLEFKFHLMHVCHQERSFFVAILIVIIFYTDMGHAVQSRCCRKRRHDMSVLNNRPNPLLDIDFLFQTTCHSLEYDSLFKVYTYSYISSCTTVGQRIDTLENDTWSEMGKHCRAAD